VLHDWHDAFRRLYFTAHMVDAGDTGECAPAALADG
jgi:hypothetical protein